MKRYEREFEALRWYQEGVYHPSIKCPADGSTMQAGLNHIGSVHLRCPECGLATYRIPQKIYDLYNQEVVRQIPL